MFTVFIIMFVIRVGLFLNEIIKYDLYATCFFLSLALSKKTCFFILIKLILTIQQTF